MLRRGLIALALVGCAASSVDGVDATEVQLWFYGEDFGDMEVCVRDVCGRVGETLVLTPPIRGDRVTVTHRLNDAELEIEYAWDFDLEVLDVDVDDAITERISLGLYRDGDGACRPYRTNHVISGTVVTSLPPAIDERVLCGPFE